MNVSEMENLIQQITDRIFPNNCCRRLIQWL